MYRFPIKDPDETLDYYIDFSLEWGEDSNDETVSCTVVVLDNTTPELEVTETGVRDDTLAYFWLSGGVADTDYLLDITVTTLFGRIYNSVYAIKVENKQVKVSA